MGFFMSKSMDANLKRQQEFMLHNSRLQVSGWKTAYLFTPCPRSPVEMLLSDEFRYNITF